MITRSLVWSLLVAAVLVCFPAVSFAGSGATVIFQSGQVVKINDGYDQIVQAVRSLNTASADHRILEMTVAGSTVLMNVAEVVMVCRDDCKSLVVIHQLDPSRAKSN